MESCGFDARKCGCFEGPNKIVHFSGKLLDLIIGRSIRCGCEVHPSPIVVIAGVVWAVLALVRVVFAGAEATSGTVGVVAGVVEVALGAAAPFWFGDIKQNSPDT